MSADGSAVAQAAEGASQDEGRPQLARAQATAGATATGSTCRIAIPSSEKRSGRTAIAWPSLM